MKKWTKTTKFKDYFLIFLKIQSLSIDRLSLLIPTIICGYSTSLGKVSITIAEFAKQNTNKMKQVLRQMKIEYVDSFCQKFKITSSLIRVISNYLCLIKNTKHIKYGDKIKINICKKTSL